MKKIVIASLLVASSLLYSDMIRLEMGGGVWSQGSSGSIKHKNDRYSIDLTDDLDVGISQDFYLWAYFKHPVPIIPNVRMEYTNTLLDGTGSNFTYNGKNYSSPTSYELGIEQVDMIAYYNILDNLAWITLDVGLDLNFMSQSYQFSNDSAVSDSIIVPMLYTRGRFQIPATGFAFESEIKYLNFGSSTVGDIRVKVDYTFDLAVVQPGVELGYRHEIIKTSRDDFSDLRNDTDITMSGVYLGAMIRF
ncbi:MAG: TIGR04219 family outer membrane beta-barrel protein [Campylobacterota bacterium]|nr:TIGR04219 family outer membrane beta-barrel protein [Campylobacterota bacterium]